MLNAQFSGKRKKRRFGFTNYELGFTIYRMIQKEMKTFRSPICEILYFKIRAIRDSKGKRDVTGLYKSSGL